MTKPLIRALGCLALLAFVFSVGLPAAVFAAEKLPPGFIALSASRMTWADAKAFCQQKGGRLPLIDNSNSLGSVPSGATVDGFGAVGAPWPSGLRNDNYWMGTVKPAPGPATSWSVTDGVGVGVGYGHQDNAFRAVCVPK